MGQLEFEHSYLVRAASYAQIPRHTSALTLAPHFPCDQGRALNRVHSVPHFPSYYGNGDRKTYSISDKYVPRGTWALDRHRDLYDNYFYDRRFELAPHKWTNYNAYEPRRRYHYNDPPYSHWWYHRGPWYSPRYRYKWSYVDYVDPLYYRRYHDPIYERAWFRPNRPHLTDIRTVDRAVDLYNSGQLTYETLDKYWLAPHNAERKMFDYKYLYPCH